MIAYRNIVCKGGITMKKFVSALCFTLLLSAVASFSANAASFSDVSKTHRYYKEISTLADAGILQGYPDGTFKPAVYVTRTQSLNILDRVPEIYIPPVRAMKTFSDLKLAHPYYDVFTRFYRGGVIDGNGDFMYPSSLVTRGQIAKVFTLYFDLNGYNGNMSFKDVPVYHDKYGVIMTLAANNITTGSNGYFMPNANLTREHLAVWLYRTLFE